MKFLIDANLPAIFPLKQQMEFIYVNQLNPEWNEREIWKYALEHRLVIVTKETDFFHWLITAQ
jgi:predicted nuclease of predicted toxin-antitoxin system